MTKSPRFRSGLEEHIWKTALRHRKKMEYEPHSISYVIKGNYTPDFLLPNGIYIEAKGRLDAQTQRKMIGVKQSNPHLDIRFVFSRANEPIRKKAKMRYWQWAEKHGFKWAEGTIPLEWFKEKKSG